MPLTKLNASALSGVTLKEFDLTDGDYTIMPVDRNILVNPAFFFDQEGISPTTTTYTTISTSGKYVADQWLWQWDGTGLTRQTMRPDGTNGSNVFNADGNTTNVRTWIDLKQSGTTSNTTDNVLYQPILGLRIFPDGSKFTVSFWAKSGNSTTIRNIRWYTYFGVGGSSAVNTSFTTNLTLTSNWTFYQFTTNFPTISGKSRGADAFSAIAFDLPIVSGTNTVQITNIKVERGSSASPWVHRVPQIDQRLCQRYFWKTPFEFKSTHRISTAPFGNNGCKFRIYFPSPMYAAPSYTTTYTQTNVNTSAIQYAATNRYFEVTYFSSAFSVYSKFNYSVGNTFNARLA